METACVAWRASCRIAMTIQDDWRDVWNFRVAKLLGHPFKSQWATDASAAGEYIAEATLEPTWRSRCRF